MIDVICVLVYVAIKRIVSLKKNLLVFATFGFKVINFEIYCFFTPYGFWCKFSELT